MKYFAAVYLLWIGISVIPTAGAITLGQIDVLRDRTTNNWTNVNPNTVRPSMNVGPSALGGLEDKFSEITAPASRADDRLTTFNRAESPANYLAAGVTGRGATALALLGAFLLWCARASHSVLVTAWNLFRP